eukprot:CAMPEP_0179130240 /NCGR_PEP_ID=MMETSP0796-20121207/61824_1 /TAXON_ID=73915 /ORGANISM="Pyrodinium bahamense, Strain pbaha01" /LENGTH=60 /DNA_ID=CAMNT_0020829137 /DNA_START=81 /DNA_END=260 /DNA_ORIENTATION=-
MVELQVSSLNGQTWNIIAEQTWTVAHVKKAIESVTRICLREQRLLDDTMELKNSDELSEV